MVMNNTGMKETPSHIHTLGFVAPSTRMDTRTVIMLRKFLIIYTTTPSGLCRVGWVMSPSSISSSLIDGCFTGNEFPQFPRFFRVQSGDGQIGSGTPRGIYPQRGQFETALYGTL